MRIELDLNESWIGFELILIEILCRNILKAEVDLTFELSAAIDLDAKIDLNASND